MRLIYTILRYYFKPNLAALVELADPKSIKGTVWQRAGSEFYNSLGAEDKDKIQHIATDWQKNGPPLDYKYAYVE